MYAALAIDHGSSFRGYLRGAGLGGVPGEDVRAGIVDAATRASADSIVVPSTYPSRAVAAVQQRGLSVCLGLRDWRVKDDTAFEHELDVLLALPQVARYVKITLWVPSARSVVAHEHARAWSERLCAKGYRIVFDVHFTGVDQRSEERTLKVLSGIDGVDALKLRLGDPERYKSYGASSVPWLCRSEGASFDVFKEQLALAVAFGGSGFMAGAALWQDLLVDWRDVDGVSHDLELRIEALRATGTRTVGRAGSVGALSPSLARQRRRS